MITRVENSSDRFRREFDRQMNRNRRANDDRFVDVVNRFEVSIDELRRDYDNARNWWEVRNSVSETIQESQQVNSMMNSLSFRRSLETQWSTLRNELNTLADTFDVAGLNGGGWQGGNWNPNGGGWQGNGTGVRPPTWAVGTFYGTSPADGAPITLTITANGQVTASVGGGQSYGVYTRGNMINIDGNRSRVYNSNDGLRTVSTSDGQTINYSRNFVGGGSYGGNVPTWAIGSFIGSSPADGSPIYLNISGDGRVTVGLGGGGSYGTLNGTTLTIDGNTSTVSRRGNGIRTTSTSDGQQIDYRRR